MTVAAMKMFEMEASLVEEWFRGNKTSWAVQSARFAVPTGCHRERRSAGRHRYRPKVVLLSQAMTVVRPRQK